MVATQKSKDQKEKRLGTLVHEEDAEQVDAFERAGKERIERDERKRGLRSVDGVIHKPKRLKWAGKPGLTRGPYQGKRQKRIPVLDSRGVPPLTSEAFDDVYLSLHRMNGKVDELALKATWRLVLSPWLRAARRHQQGRVSRTPNFITPYVLAVVAAHYLFTSTADTDLARAFQVRRELWSFLQEHVPVTEAQANAIGFDDCWLEGRAYPERYVGYTARAGGVHKSYHRLVRLWVQNEDQQVWLKPTPTVPALTGFVPVYERRRKEGSKKKIRVQVNKEDNARARRARARLEKQLVYAAAQLNGANGEATGKDDVPSLEEILAKYGIQAAATNKLRDHWLKCVAQLMLAVGTDHVEDIIQLATHQCDYRMLTVCPSCFELDFSENATEHDVDTYDRLWCEKWYSSYCSNCTNTHQNVRCTTLNGLNGEATNKDDVKGRRQSGGKKGKGKRKVVRVNTVVLPKQRKLTNAMRPNSMELKRYMLALTNPFHPEAVGAKSSVYAYRNAVPYTIRWKGIIQTQQLEGCDIILQPNPAFYGWCSSNGSFEAVRSVLGPLEVIGPVDNFGFTGSLVDRTGFDVPSIASTLSSFRVVGGGIKIKSVFQSNASQSLSTIVPILMQNSDLSYRDVTGGASPVSTTYTNSVAGTSRPTGYVATFAQQVLTGNTFSTSSILTVPDAKEFTTYDLLSNTICAVFKPVTPEAFEFKDCGSENPQMVNNAVKTVGPVDINDWDYGTGTAAAAARRGTTDAAGWSGLYISTTSTYNTAQGNATYELDYILHCEGYPRVQGISGQVSQTPVQSESVVLNAIKRVRQITVEAISSHGPSLARNALNMAVQNMMRQTNAMPRLEL